MMPIEPIEHLIRDELTKIVDPETGLSIMRMNIIHDLKVGQHGEVSLVFRPSSPVCPMAFALANSIKTRIEALDGVLSLSMKVENYNRAEQLENVLSESSSTK
jgi:metal-sulfur cluster biosynthetic enzyme